MIDDEYLQLMRENYERYRRWNRTHCNELQIILSNHSILLPDYCRLKSAYLELKAQNHDLCELVDGLHLSTKERSSSMARKTVLIEKTSEESPELDTEKVIVLPEPFQSLAESAAERAKKEMELRMGIVEINKLMCENSFFEARRLSRALLEKNDIESPEIMKPQSCFHYHQPVSSEGSCPSEQISPNIE